MGRPKSGGPPKRARVSPPDSPDPHPAGPEQDAQPQEAPPVSSGRAGLDLIFAHLKKKMSPP